MPEPRSPEALVAEAAARIFGRDSKPSGLTALEGGRARRSFVLSVGGERLVAKIPEAGTGSTISPAEELELLGRLAALDLTPRPLAHDLETGVTFSDYLSGSRAWTPADIAEPGNIERVAARLRELHSVDARIRAFDPAAFVLAYAPGSETAKGELEALMPALESIGEARVLCHNDLAASNLLDDGRLRFVDLEYAAMAPPVVDLASLAAMNGLGAGPRRQVLEAYYGDAGEPCSMETFDKIVRIQRLIAKLWMQARPAG